MFDHFFSLILSKGIFFTALSQSTTYRPPLPLKSGHIGIKDAQYAETYEKTFSVYCYFIFLDMVDFVFKII